MNTISTISNLAHRLRLKLRDTGIGKYSAWEINAYINEAIRKLREVVDISFYGTSFALPNTTTLADTDDTGWPTQYDDLIIKHALITATLVDDSAIEQELAIWMQKVIALTAITNKKYFATDQNQTAIVKNLRTLLNDLDMAKYSNYDLTTYLNKAIRLLRETVTNNFRDFAFTVPTNTELSVDGETGWPSEFNDLIVEYAMTIAITKDYQKLEQTWKEKIIQTTSTLNKNTLIADATQNALLMKLRIILGDLDMSMYSQYELTAHINKAIGETRTVVTMFYSQLSFAVPLTTELVDGATGWSEEFDKLIIELASVLAMPGDYGAKEQAKALWKQKTISLAGSKNIAVNRIYGAYGYRPKEAVTLSHDVEVDGGNAAGG